MNAPFPGMQTQPYGLPLMTGAWLGLVQYLAGQPDARAAFTAATGHDLSSLGSRGFDRMIDEATGRDVALVAAWCDFVTREVWGEERDNNGGASHV